MKKKADVQEKEAFKDFQELLNGVAGSNSPNWCYIRLDLEINCQP